jgi:hypothetical protein
MNNLRANATRGLKSRATKAEKKRGTSKDLARYNV